MPNLQICEPEVDEEGGLENDLEDTELGVGVEGRARWHVADGICFLKVDVLITEKQEIEDEGDHQGDVIKKSRVFVHERKTPCLRHGLVKIELSHQVEAAFEEISDSAPVAGTVHFLDQTFFGCFLEVDFASVRHTEITTLSFSVSKDFDCSDDFCHFLEGFRLTEKRNDCFSFAVGETTTGTGTVYCRSILLR